MALFLSPPPPRSIFAGQFTNRDAYAIANGIDGMRTIGGGTGPFHARVVQLDLGPAFLVQGEASEPVTMAGPVPAGLHSFTFATRAAAPRMLCGRQVGFGQVFHFRPNDLFHAHSPGGAPWPFATVVTRFETLARLAPSYAGRDIAPAADDTALVTASPADRDRLIALLQAAAVLATRQPEIPRQDAPAQSLAGAVLDALLACLTQGRAEPDRAAIRRHRRLIARLERLMEERPDHPWSIAELCTAIGAAERTVNLACHEFYGAGAMRVLRDRRLDLVRRALHAADPFATTVAAQAMRFGFWELGRFAGAYRRRFGEPPSATLRRPAG